MNIRWRLLCLILLGAQTIACTETFEQVISREDPGFDCHFSELAVGQDGLVYLYHGLKDDGLVLRMTADGAQRTVGRVAAA